METGKAKTLCMDAGSHLGCVLLYILAAGYDRMDHRGTGGLLCVDLAGGRDGFLRRLLDVFHIIQVRNLPVALNRDGRNASWTIFIKWKLLYT